MKIKTANGERPISQTAQFLYSLKNGHYFIPSYLRVIVEGKVFKFNEKGPGKGISPKKKTFLRISKMSHNK